MVTALIFRQAIWERRGEPLSSPAAAVANATDALHVRIKEIPITRKGILEALGGEKIRKMLEY
jgi:hypothetical protein